MLRNLLLLSAVLSPAVFGLGCTSTLYKSGTINNAPYLVYMPQNNACFNGDMIIYAHGYVTDGSAPGTWESQLTLPDGTSLPGLLNSLGFGFAASGYSKDGLAIKEGISDTDALTKFVQTLPIPTKRFIITGVSEGGLIAAKLAEQDPIYDGAISTCGPIGDFQAQINYLGDVRVVFDYFFPGVLTSAGGDALHPPQTLRDNWDSTYEPAVENALKSNPIATWQLIAVTGVETGLTFSSQVDAVIHALWYDVFATGNASAVLGGNPYDNISRIYKGSLNDARLNANVARFVEASNVPAELINDYDTTGVLQIPMVTLHTTSDPSVPYWHESLYLNKVKNANDTANLTQIPVVTYGHCQFSALNALGALATLELKMKH